MAIRSEVAKNNMIFTAGNIAAALLSFVFSIIVARMLQPEQFGLFSFALVVTGFFTVFVDLGISNIAVKFMSGFFEEGEGGKAAAVAGMLFRFRLSSSLVIGIAMAVFSEQISSLVFNKPGSGFFVMLAAALLIANSLLDFFNIVLLGMKKFRCLVAARISERVLKIAFVVVLVAAGFSAYGAVSGVALSVAAVALIGGMLLRRRNPVLRAGGSGVQPLRISQEKHANPSSRGRRKVQTPRISQDKQASPSSRAGCGIQRSAIFSFGLWASAGAIISSIYSMTDALMVSMMLGVESVGFYSIAISWMTLVTYAVPISSVVMYPYFSSFSGSRSQNALHNSVKYALAAALPVGLLMSAFSTPIIRIFYGAPFAQAASALSALSIASIALVLSPILLGYLYGAGKPKMHSFVIALVLAMNIPLNYALIGAFGIWGAAAATLVSRAVEVAVLLCIISLLAKNWSLWKVAAKPAAASIIIYMLASWLPVQGLAELVGYGIGLLGLYITIMIASGGIEKEDIMLMVSYFRSVLRL